MKRAVLLMAHGAPRNLDEIEDYVMRIRHGRPLPAAQMEEIKDRYRIVGGSPLLHLTHLQAEALQRRLEKDLPAAGNVYVGMRHSAPYIKEAIRQMALDSVETITALCLAPQFSSLTIGAYRKALEEAISDSGKELHFSMVNSYARHPGLIRSFQTRLKEALLEHPGAFVIFTAHSLPERVVQQGDPYDFEVKETARLLALSAGLPDWRFAYQSQGMTSDRWLGPTVETRIDELSAKGITEVLIAPIGFVCDHVEILFDIDVAFRKYAEQKGIRLYRSSSLNDSPEFIDLLFALIREQQ